MLNQSINQSKKKKKSLWKKFANVKAASVVEILRTPLVAASKVLLFKFR